MMSNTLINKSDVLFGARPLGSVQLPLKKDSPKKSVQVDIYQLTGTDEDIAFLKQGEARIKQESASGQGVSMVPDLPGIHRSNHVELVAEGFERTRKLFEQWRQNELIQPPQVLVAVRSDNQELAGLELTNIERTLPDGDKIYTPLKHHLETDKTRNALANHTSINWLFTLTPLKGIGLALSSLLNLPESVERIDVVSEDLRFTPQASRLYEGLGFKRIPNMENEKPIPTNPNTQESEISSFQEMHGIPMTATRADYSRKAAEVRSSLEFEADFSSAGNVDLTKRVSFPSHSLK